MRLLIVAAGRMKPGPLRQLQDDFAARIVPAIVIREVEERRSLSPAELKAREGEKLLAEIPGGALAVALDSQGRALSSPAFAEALAGWLASGKSALAFVIGGAEGLGAEVLARADARLSLGAMTWPHLLARVMLLEQIYRAQQILRGGPYHR